MSRIVEHHRRESKSGGDDRGGAAASSDGAAQEGKESDGRAGRKRDSPTIQTPRDTRGGGDVGSKRTDDADVIRGLAPAGGAGGTASAAPGATGGGDGGEDDWTTGTAASRPGAGGKTGDTAAADPMSNIQSYMVLGTRFDVESRYTIINSVGQGAYGVVCAARDEKSNTVVAIKKIERAFEHQTFTKRTLRELKLLRSLRHENIIRLDTILWPLDLENFDEIYCVFELMETDLASIIKSPQPLSDEHCQFFLYQILRGLKYIHSRNVIHRDLKPRNLLVNSNCDLKVSLSWMHNTCNSCHVLAFAHPTRFFYLSPLPPPIYSAPGSARPLLAFFLFTLLVLHIDLRLWTRACRLSQPAGQDDRHDGLRGDAVVPCARGDSHLGKVHKGHRRVVGGMHFR